MRNFSETLHDRVTPLDDSRTPEPSGGGGGSNLTQWVADAPLRLNVESHADGDASTTNATAAAAASSAHQTPQPPGATTPNEQRNGFPLDWLVECGVYEGEQATRQSVECKNQGFAAGFRQRKSVRTETRAASSRLLAYNSRELKFGIFTA